MSAPTFVNDIRLYRAGLQIWYKASDGELRPGIIVQNLGDFRYKLRDATTRRYLKVAWPKFEELPV